MQVLGGKTGYNDDARYCLVVATKIDGRTYYMAFLGDEGKLTRFGDVARVADWIVSHKPKTASRAAAAAPAGRRRRLPRPRAASRRSAAGADPARLPPGAADAAPVAPAATATPLSAAPASRARRQASRRAGRIAAC